MAWLLGPEGNRVSKGFVLEDDLEGEPPALDGRTIWLDMVCLADFGHCRFFMQNTHAVQFWCSALLHGPSDMLCWLGSQA